MRSGYILRLAVRNALRNRRRSLFTMLSLVLGIGIFVLARGLISGIELTMVSLEIDAEHAHLRVVTPEWYEDQDYGPLDLPFDDGPAVAALLKERFPDALVSGRTAFAAELGDGVRGTPCRGLAIDPAVYARMYRLGDLTSDEPGAHVWLGASLAAVFDLKPGDRVFLQAKTQQGARNALDDVVVAGLLETGHPLIDNFSLLMPREHAATFLDLEDGFSTAIIARFQDPDQADEADVLLAERFPELMAETWREKTAYIIELNQIRENVFNVLIAIILLIGASGVANTCLMSGFERTTEVGTMLALGLPRKRVLRLFMLESAFIAAVGASLGAAIGGTVSYFLQENGIDFPEVGDQAGSVPIPARLYFDASWEVVVVGVVMGLAIATLAALYPAWRASRLDPIVALREGGG